MDLRKEKEFEIQFAETNRLKNSSTPYMQKILNTEKEKGKIFWGKEY